MAGLENLLAQVQPITGPASLDAVAAALSPEEQAMVAAGKDPYAEGGLIGQQALPGMTAQTGGPGSPARPAGGLTPEARMAIGQALQETLNAIGQPANEADAVAVQSIQNAMTALVGG